MNPGELLLALEGLDNQKAAEVLRRALARLLSAMPEEERGEFILGLFGEVENDKVASMVYLWLAECLGEGVDPTKMCQRLVAKVAQSEQLQSVAVPEVLILFEDWMEELEREMLVWVRQRGDEEIIALADELGLSRSGATFLITKLRNEGKL